MPERGKWNEQRERGRKKTELRDRGHPHTTFTIRSPVTHYKVGRAALKVLDDLLGSRKLWTKRRG